MRAQSWYAVSAIILVLSGCFPTTPANVVKKETTLTHLFSSKKIKVGYIVFPPAIIKSPNTKELSGHFVDTIKEIAKQSDLEIEFIESDWATFTSGLSAGRFDLSIAPTFVTVPRAKTVAFTKPLFYAGNSAIVRKGESRFKTIQSIDVKGIKIAVTQGEAGAEYAKSNIKNAEIISFSGSDQSLAMQSVISGRADIALGDAYVTSKFAAANSAKVTDLFAGKPYNLTPVSWATRPEDTDLINFIDSSLEALETQGKLIDFEKKSGATWLHKKYFWEIPNLK